MSNKITYLARDVESLRNGSFFKVCRYGVSQYINGDYMGLFPKGTPAPTEDDGVPLITYGRREAKFILPACCV